MRRLMLTRALPLKRLPYAHLIHELSFRVLSTDTIPPHTPLSLKHPITIHQMSKKDLSVVMEWAEKEGWNPGRYEAEPLYAADPKGYYMLRVNEQPIASLAAVRHSHRFAFLGLYIVLPEFRGQGYGKLLWDFVMGNIRACSTIGLNGTLPQVGAYEKSGFSPAGLNTRWSGKCPDTHPGRNSGTEHITTAFPIEDLIAYDSSVFSTPRRSFITKWIEMPESHVLASLDRQGNIRGYGVISRTVNGYKIAPLFADNLCIAESILQRLCHYVPPEATITIDTSETNTDACLLARKLGFKKIFDTMRMYKGPEPEVDHRKSFSLTSLEIG